MGRPELIENPRYATNEARMQHNDELQALVSGWVGERPRDEILKVLDEYEVVCSQVNDASDIVEDPHFKERTLVELTGVEALGRVLMPGPVLHFDGYAGPVYDGVPAIGEHTDEVLTDLLSLTRGRDHRAGRGRHRALREGRRPRALTAGAEMAGSGTPPGVPKTAISALRAGRRRRCRIEPVV